MACVFLASKIEEDPRPLHSVVRAFHRVNQIRKNKEPTELTNEYSKIKPEVVKAERRILKELGFCVYVNHPHKFVVSLLKILTFDTNQKFAQTAWSYMNDGLRTDVFLRYPHETIACSCIYLSARILEIPLPESPPWWQLFSVSEEDIHIVCKMILRLYTRPKPDQERLESIIDKLKKETDRGRLNIMKQFSAPTPNDSPKMENHSTIKKIKIEHIIQDVKRKSTDRIERNLKDKEIERIRKSHERNHSRSPKRSRSRSRENSRRKYSNKDY